MCLCTHWFILQKPAKAAVSGQGRPKELNAGLPCEWQKTKHLDLHLLPNGTHNTRKLQLEVELGLEARDPKPGWEHPRSIFITVLNTHARGGAHC